MKLTSDYNLSEREAPFVELNKAYLIKVIFFLKQRLKVSLCKHHRSILHRNSSTSEIKKESTNF